MINGLVEKKYEYTIQLVNILTSLIYEGLNSIYTEALKSSIGTENILKVFQSFLRRIPKWEPEIIKQETNRIMTSSKSEDWLPNLVKASLKANMCILVYNPSLKIQNKIDSKYYKDIKIEDFIHKVYIECARELWNNPYLMYHQYPTIELKRNQRDTIILIKEAIKEAIRKLLPLKQMLELYLDDELELNNVNDIDKNISDVEQRNMLKLITKDLKGEIDNELSINSAVNDTTKVIDVTKENDATKLIDVIKENDTTKLIDATKINDTTEVNNSTKKLLDNINTTTSIKSTDNQNKNRTNNQLGGMSNINNEATQRDLNSEILNIINNDNSNNEYYSPNKIIGGNMDDKITNILKNELDVSDLETSLSYHAETNDNNYQEIFANSIAPQLAKNQYQNKGNSIKDTSKNKRKFFNNYLNI